MHRRVNLLIRPNKLSIFALFSSALLNTLMTKILPNLLNVSRLHSGLTTVLGTTFNKVHTLDRSFDAVCKLGLMGVGVIPNHGHRPRQKPSRRGHLRGRRRCPRMRPRRIRILHENWVLGRSVPLAGCLSFGASRVSKVNPSILAAKRCNLSWTRH